MNEKTRKMIVWGSLVCATIYGAYNFTGSDEPASHRQDQIKTIAPLPAQATVQSIEQFIDVEEESKTAWGADPFRAKKVRKTRAVKIRRDQPDWFLSGILYNSSQPLAVINKRTVKAGDTIDQAKVIQINREKVLLEYNGNRIELTVTKG